MKVRKHRLYFLLMAVFFVTVAVSVTKTQKERHYIKVQEGIAHQIIRFHVRANSDSEKDQELKLKVKDGIVTYLKPLLENSDNINTSRQIIVEHEQDIKETAMNILKNEGSDYTVSTYFENSYFPMKTYGDMTFPPGEYEAFRVDIGKSEGKNWWCVLFPPLCLVDSSVGVVSQESKETFKNILTDEEYNAITNIQYSYEFKYFKFLNRFLK